jgi:23S rRNA-/tRNA-specific pseudouridylate synthase
LKNLEVKLDEIAVGKRYKQKRNTLLKQCERIRDILANNSSELCKDNPSSLCRSCGDECCDGECWGFHGLKPKKNVTKTPRLSANRRASKVAQKDKDIEEIKQLRLSQPPNVHRNNESSLRCPPPCIRILTSSVKGKWCGRTIKSVMASEFHEFSNLERLEEVFKYNLVYIDGIPVNSEAALRRGTDANKALSPDTLLKNMDTISRIQHWHEPPIIVPDRIDIEQVEVPKAVCEELIQNVDDRNESYKIYCINKPATVPVHHAGAYYQNSLLLMVEAQEGLATKSLLPCHRVDRCTSGLTICCNNPKVARLIQVQMDLKTVSKMYLARVKVNISVPPFIQIFLFYSDVA